MSGIFDDDEDIFGSIFGAVPRRPKRRRKVARQETAPANGYDLAARRYAVTQGDPYQQAAEREVELGRRLPLPYEAASALAGWPSVTGQPIHGNYQDENVSPAVYPAPSAAGIRQTRSGAFPSLEQGPPVWDARERFGYGELGARGPGYSDRWDTRDGGENTGTRLDSTTKFDQDVMPGRPYLHIRAIGSATQAEGTYNGNAIISISAGNSKFGAAQFRRFWVGGGIVACFDLRGWDNIKFNLEELMAGTYVEFAWTTKGLAGPDRSLQYPETYTAAGTTIPVPEGAYALSVEYTGVATTQLDWVGRRAGASAWTFTESIGTSASGASVFFGQQIPVKGPTFKLSNSADILWWIRPI